MPTEEYLGYWLPEPVRHGTGWQVVFRRLPAARVFIDENLCHAEGETPGEATEKAKEIIDEFQNAVPGDLVPE